MSHRTTWEDEGMAGVVCSTNPTGTFTVTAGEPPEQCPSCGAWLKLIWHVSLEAQPGEEKKPKEGER